MRATPAVVAPYAVTIERAIVAPGGMPTVGTAVPASVSRAAPMPAVADSARGMASNDLAVDTARMGGAATPPGMAAPASAGRAVPATSMPVELMNDRAIGTPLPPLF